MRHLAFIAAVLLVITSAGCDRFVQGIDPPIDNIDDGKLDTEEQLPFLIAGLDGAFAKAYGRLSLLSGALSDEMEFQLNVPGATSLALMQIDHGSILLDNDEAEAAIALLGQYRYQADDLLARCGRITFSDTTVRNEALFYGLLHGGISRYLWGSYFGLSEESGGGVIDSGPFIPTSQMYQLALAKLNEALPYAPDQARKHAVGTLIARIHLIEGRYGEAENGALQGLAAGEHAMSAVFGPEARTDWHEKAGHGRTQLVAAQRFRLYLDEDPAEAARIPMETVTGADQTTLYERQAKYASESAPIPFVTWQENELILAETAVRAGRAAEALGRINAVRASHGLDPRMDTALDSLFIERDKELFGTGLRLLDQRRFDAWHPTPGAWRYLPITRSERDGNGNI